MCFVSQQSLIFVAQCHMLLIWSEPLKQEEIKWSKIGVIYAIGYLRTTSPPFFPAETVILLNFGENVLRETSPLLGQGMKHEGCSSSSHSPFTGSLNVTEFWSTGLKRKSVLQGFWERFLPGKINMYEEKTPQSPFLSGPWMLL